MGYVGKGEVCGVVWIWCVWASVCVGYVYVVCMWCGEYVCVWECVVTVVNMCVGMVVMVMGGVQCVSCEKCVWV